jgi:hypothetical protein
MIHTCLKCQSKTPLDYQDAFLKSEGQEEKIGLSLGWGTVGGERT